MIPVMNIIAWSNVAPWAEQRQIELFLRYLESTEVAIARAEAERRMFAKLSNCGVRGPAESRDASPVTLESATSVGSGGSGEGSMKPEVYVSTDVETDGPIPGPHSMLSFASAAFAADGALISTFTANLELLPGASGHLDTMRWWSGRPEAWEACRRDLRPPAEAMPAYRLWLEALPGRPVFVAYPAGFDFTFVYWYLVRYAGKSPFSHSALDIKTYAMAILRKGYRDSVKKSMPRRWFSGRPHTHIALDDAIEQGELFCRMLSENLGRK